MRVTNRRQFFWTAMGACGPLALGAAVWLPRDRADLQTAGDSPLPGVPDGLQTATESFWAMGSPVSVTVLHADADVAGRAVKAAAEEVRLVETVTSLYRPGSQLCRLNRDGVLDHPHPHLVAVLRAAEQMARQSEGAFDVTMQPLWTLYAEAQRAGGLPETAAIDAAVRKVDWRRVAVAPQRIRLGGRGAAVTLNGIAQGFAADRAMAELRRCGIRHALVNSGEIASLGGKAAGEAWTVGIQHPRRKDAYLALARLRGRCLATSGDYATSFSKDFRENHLFDPHTGRSPESFSSVSVAAPTATLADAMSTAVFVLGPEKGLRLVRSTPGADALLVFKDGRTLATEGFPEGV